MNYCQCLITATRVPLTINITVQRLDINVVLGILRWDLPLFEFVDYCIWLLMRTCLFVCFVLFTASAYTISANINYIPCLMGPL